MTPEGWTLSRLGDVTDVAIGGTPSRSAPELWDPERRDGYRWVAISDLKGRVVAETAEYISALGVQRSNVKRVPAGTPIMSFKLSIGRTALAGCELYTNEAIAAFHRREPVEPGYLLYALPRAAEEHGEADVAVKGKTLNKAKLIELPLLLPPLGEQRKIAAILSSVDDAIEATQAVIEQLQVVKKAMMAELMTRGLPGRHTRFKMTEIGEVPEEWEVVFLSSVGHLQTGLAKGKSVASDVDLPYLRVANVQDGRVDLSEVKTITVEEKSIERYRLRSGDVLFTEGGDADKLGRGCVWRGQIDPCLHQNHVFAVRPQTQRLLPEFLSYWAASPCGKAYFLDCAKQTTNLASINSTQLKALPVPLPRLPEQSAIVEALGAVEGRLGAEDAVVRGIGAAKAALMSVLLTGEVRVNPDEEAA
jgi:type I restriction enzyme S subunit